MTILVRITMGLAPFSKDAAEASRSLLERTTGICLGRGNWEGTGVFYVSPDQHVRFYAAALASEDDVLISAVRAAGVSVEDDGETTCVFYGRGIKSRSNSCR